MIHPWFAAISTWKTRKILSTFPFGLALFFFFSSIFYFSDTLFFWIRYISQMKSDHFNSFFFFFLFFLSRALIGWTLRQISKRECDHHCLHGYILLTFCIVSYLVNIWKRVRLFNQSLHLPDIYLVIIQVSSVKIIRQCWG